MKKMEGKLGRIRIFEDSKDIFVLEQGVEDQKHQLCIAIEDIPDLIKELQTLVKDHRKKGYKIRLRNVLDKDGKSIKFEVIDLDVESVELLDGDLEEITEDIGFIKMFCPYCKHTSPKEEFKIERESNGKVRCPRCGDWFCEDRIEEFTIKDKVSALEDKQPLGYENYHDRCPLCHNKECTCKEGKKKHRCVDCTDFNVGLSKCNKHTKTVFANTDACKDITLG
jgi:hypothetical protein